MVSLGILTIYPFVSDYILAPTPGIFMGDCLLPLVWQKL